MTLIRRWAPALLVLGLVAMLIGAIDALEGSLVILAGSAMVMLSALLGRNRRLKLLAWSFVLVAVGCGALWGFSALGGFGGNTGRSNWWGFVLLPYPVGWLLGLIGGIQLFREICRRPFRSGAT